MEKKSITKQEIPDIEPYSRVFKGKKGVPIHQYGLDGKYIKTFESINEAAKTLKIASASIQACITRKGKSAGGFQWRRA